MFSRNFYNKLKSYFCIKYGAYDYKHGWMKMDCPICGKQQKFGINLSRNRTNCFVCNYHKSPIQLIMDLERLNTYHEVFNFLNDNNFSGYEYKPIKVEIRKQKITYLPDGFRLLNMGKSQMAISARSYLKQRGFDINELSKKGWGYCVSGDYSGYIIIPFMNSGKLVYFNARNYLSSGPRYNNPELNITGLGKAMQIYNIDALAIYNTIYICEGSINAETMGERGIACGGKSVSAYQINLMIKSSVDRFIILLDPDAFDKAIKLGLSLVNFKKVKVILLPGGYDVNDLGKRKVMSFIYKTHYQNYSDLIALRNEKRS